MMFVPHICDFPVDGKLSIFHYMCDKDRTLDGNVSTLPPLQPRKDAHG
jgi:hypothetical protein